VSPVRYELGFYIPKDDILHSPRRDNLKRYTVFLPVYVVLPAAMLERIVNRV
jgi:hypothetical protein